MTKENYIIENDNWDEEKPIDRKTVKLSNSDLPEGLEIIETKTKKHNAVKMCPTPDSSGDPFEKHCTASPRETQERESPNQS